MDDVRERAKDYVLKKARRARIQRTIQPSRQDPELLIQTTSNRRAREMAALWKLGKFSSEQFTFSKQKAILPVECEDGLNFEGLRREQVICLEYTEAMCTDQMEIWTSLRNGIFLDEWNLQRERDRRVGEIYKGVIMMMVKDDLKGMRDREKVDVL